MNKNTINSFEYYVSGMHCTSCELLINENLSKHFGIVEVNANKIDQKVQVKTTDPNENYESLRLKLREHIADFGYDLHPNKINFRKININELIKGFLFALLFIFIFYLLQKIGLINSLNSNEINLPFIFMIGVIASLSSCMAVVGGLVLSISSQYVKSGGNKYGPILKFNLSRIISFFVFGGVVGSLGSIFMISTTTYFFINIVLFIVMIILGLSLLDINPIFNKYQFTFGTKILGRINRICIESEKFKKSLNIYGPILLGMLTFFLPCGFTQSMQMYSLSTGNFVNGALTMFVFSLGTAPILFLISILPLKFMNILKSGVFFKTAGFIIIFFAIINLIGAMVSSGLISL